jgi:hypothetical protein
MADSMTKQCDGRSVASEGSVEYDSMKQGKKQVEQPTCTLLEKVPLEIRRRIYSYLVPDLPISHNAEWVRPLRRDQSPVSTELFRVNRQIHEEYAEVFYGSAPFAVYMSNDLSGQPIMKMCCGLRGLYPIEGWNLQPLAAMYFRRIRSFRFYISFNLETHTQALFTGLATTATIASLMNLTPHQMMMRHQAERGRLCELFHQVIRGTHRLLRDVGVYIEIQRDDNRPHPGPQLIDQWRDHISRGHCLNLLSPLMDGELRAHREATIDCWSRSEAQARVGDLRDMRNLCGSCDAYPPVGPARGRNFLDSGMDAHRAQVLGREWMEKLREDYDNGIWQGV